MDNRGTPAGSTWAWVVLAASVALAGCRIGAVLDVDEDATAQARRRAAASKPEAPPPETQTFAWHMRELGEEIGEKIGWCRKNVLDRLSVESARKALPIVSAEDFRAGCRPVAVKYDQLKEKLWARHYTADGMLAKLARFKDNYAIALALIEARKPGDALADAIDELRRVADRIGRNADALAAMSMEAQPRDVVEPREVSIGQLRAYVDRMVRNDRSDLGTLYDKWVQFAFEPARAGRPVWKASLEHFGQVRKRWVAIHRKTLAAMKTDKPELQRRIVAVVERYLDASDSYVRAYLDASRPYLEGTPPDARTARRLKKNLEQIAATWRKRNESLASDIAAVL